MIPRFSPDYHWADLAKCFGPPKPNAVATLESRFAELTRHESAIAFRYGRSGLYFLLKALGAKNKKVVLPSYTCVVVAHAVTLSGNTPVFLDNAPNRLQPDPLDYLRAIDSETAMIIPTHLFGIAEETSDLFRQVKEKHPSVFVLQDCAHSFFCRDSTGNVVTTYGDGAIFGMNISKLVNSVYGGMLTLNDPKLADEVKKIVVAENMTRNKAAGLKSRTYATAAAVAFTSPGYGVVSWLSKHSSLLDSETEYFNEDKIELPDDFSAPMLPFEAEVGLSSLDRFDERVQRRREIANFYIERLSGLKRASVPEFKVGNTWSHFPLLVPSEIRNELKTEIEREFGVEIGVIVDYSVADLPVYKKLGSTPCPRAAEAVDQILNLPLTFGEGLWPLRQWERIAGAISDMITARLKKK